MKIVNGFRLFSIDAIFGAMSGNGDMGGRWTPHPGLSRLICVIRFSLGDGPCHRCSAVLSQGRAILSDLGIQSPDRALIKFCLHVVGEWLSCWQLFFSPFRTVGGLVDYLWDLGFGVRGPLVFRGLSWC